MRLDENGLEAGAEALCIGLGSACPIPLFSDHHKVVAQIITAYLAAIVPGDVRELAAEARKSSEHFNVRGNDGMPYTADLLARLSTALLTLSAENAELKNRIQT